MFCGIVRGILCIHLTHRTCVIWIALPFKLFFFVCISHDNTSVINAIQFAIWKLSFKILVSAQLDGHCRMCIFSDASEVRRKAKKWAFEKFECRKSAFLISVCFSLGSRDIQRACKPSRGRRVSLGPRNGQDKEVCSFDSFVAYLHVWPMYRLLRPTKFLPTKFLIRSEACAASTLRDAIPHRRDEATGTRKRFVRSTLSRFCF